MTVTDSAECIRILFLSDTHLGVDLPANPRIHRRRRGDDFYGNFQYILEHARKERMDFIIHGGDLFYRSRIKSDLVMQAFGPIIETAEAGIPVIIVPGNHERSRIPYRLLTAHPDVHIFHKPGTVRLNVRGTRVAVAGFPFVRGDIRSEFRRYVTETGWDREPSDVRLLCIHQAVDGASVGPVNFTFRYRSDVIDPREIPQEFHAVLCGHIHRAQEIRRDLIEKPLPVPVYMAGSIERTAFAERFEDKGFMDFDICKSSVGKWIMNGHFRRVKTRPMILHDLYIDSHSGAQLENMIQEVIASYPSDAILRLVIHVSDSERFAGVLPAPKLREMAPETMNISVAWKALNLDEST